MSKPWCVAWRLLWPAWWANAFSKRVITGDVFPSTSTPQVISPTTLILTDICCALPPISGLLVMPCSNYCEWQACELNSDFPPPFLSPQKCQWFFPLLYLAHSWSTFFKNEPTNKKKTSHHWMLFSNTKEIRRGIYGEGKNTLVSRAK